MPAAVTLDAASPLPAFGFALVASTEKVAPSPASPISKCGANTALPLAFGLHRTDDVIPSALGEASPLSHIFGVPASRNSEKAQWQDKVAELYEERALLLRTVSGLEDECSRYRSIVKAQDSSLLSSDAGSEGAESPVKREVRLLKSHVATLQRQVEESTTRAQDAERRAAGSARALRVAGLRVDQLEAQVSGGETPSGTRSRLVMDLAEARHQLESQSAEVEGLRKRLEEAAATTRAEERGKRTADAARRAAEREKEAAEEDRRSLEAENARLKTELAQARSRQSKPIVEGTEFKPQGSTSAMDVEVAALVNELQIAMEHSKPGARDPAKVLSSVLATLEDSLRCPREPRDVRRSPPQVGRETVSGPASKRVTVQDRADHAAGPSPHGTPLFPSRFPNASRSGTPLCPSGSPVRVTHAGYGGRSDRPSERSPGRERFGKGSTTDSGPGRGIPFHSSSRLSRKMGDGASTPSHSMSIRE
mmetsp:Transcript_18370/g.39540  ORF Transcript_18370/g.39540 Transcript_18370/m.39540 type:complete len:479 (+) Transcript_18370:31-1467(+)